MKERPQNKNLGPTMFRPGVSGNPEGARAHDPLKKALKRITQPEVHDVMAMILGCDLEGLQAVTKDKNSSVLRVWVASAAVKAINKGDLGALEILLNRLHGKPQERVKLSGSVDSGSTSEKVLALAKELERIRSEKNEPEST